MEEKIRAFCLHQRLVTIVIPDEGLALNCRFASSAKGDLLLDILSPPPTNLRFPAACTGVFSEGSRIKVFLSFVKEMLPREPFPRLVVTLPDGLLTGESRTAFRVPLSESDGLEATVESPEQKWRTEPIDISLGGILLRFTDPEVPDLWQFDDLTVTLKLEDSTVVLEGFPGRRDGDCYAIYFSDSLRQLRAGSDAVPLGLREILNRLERGWAARKAALPSCGLTAPGAAEAAD